MECIILSITMLIIVLVILINGNIKNAKGLKRLEYKAKEEISILKARIGILARELDNTLKELKSCK